MYEVGVGFDEKRLGASLATVGGHTPNGARRGGRDETPTLGNRASDLARAAAGFAPVDVGYSGGCRHGFEFGAYHSSAHICGRAGQPSLLRVLRLAALVGRCFEQQTLDADTANGQNHAATQLGDANAKVATEADQ